MKVVDDAHVMPEAVSPGSGYAKKIFRHIFEGGSLCSRLPSFLHLWRTSASLSAGLPRRHTAHAHRTTPLLCTGTQHDWPN